LQIGAGLFAASFAQGKFRQIIVVDGGAFYPVLAVFQINGLFEQGARGVQAVLAKVYQAEQGIGVGGVEGRESRCLFFYQGGQNPGTLFVIVRSVKNFGFELQVFEYAGAVAGFLV